MTAHESTPARGKNLTEGRTESKRCISAGYDVDVWDERASLDIQTFDSGDRVAAELELGTIFGNVTVALSDEQARLLATELLDVVGDEQ
ncbi:hypothetical protein [Haloferax marisrubri]|uniref:hypothetical protein n=1 Tax=Haloferax marisrubri TaxID=1544719 RepID=UPI000A5F11B9|nr:hypothetical protein [Haloferax marisrubri]